MKTLTFTEPNKLWFTSDTHLHHTNIIQYCNRPFKDTGHMNRSIIDNWCNVVQPDDTIIHAGDFCWGDTKMWLYFLSQLTGNIILVRGNHDRIGTIPKTHLALVAEILNIRVVEPDNTEQRICICHYPMLSWYQSHRGSWQLFGHLHGKLRDPVLSEDGWDVRNKLTTKQLDIGTDCHNFTPISYYEVKKIIEENLEKSK